MSNQFGWLWDGEGREEEWTRVGFCLFQVLWTDASVIPPHLDLAGVRRTQASILSLLPRQLPWENKESGLADGGGLGNAILSPKFRERNVKAAGGQRVLTSDY